MSNLVVFVFSLYVLFTLMDLYSAWSRRKGYPEYTYTYYFFKAHKFTVLYIGIFAVLWYTIHILR